MHGRWLGAAEYAEKRFAELSVIDEVDNDVIGRAEDGQCQLHQDEPTGPFGTAGLAGQFLQEQNRCFRLILVTFSLNSCTRACMHARTHTHTHTSIH